VREVRGSSHRRARQNASKRVEEGVTEGTTTRVGDVDHCITRYMLRVSVVVTGAQRGKKRGGYYQRRRGCQCVGGHGER